MYLLGMFVENLCSPAILYLGFALTQIVIDLFRKMYNTAIVKSAVAIVFTTVLNMLCARGLGVISWFIVFIPFVTMTFVTGILLYVFGLAPFTGKLSYSGAPFRSEAMPWVVRRPAPLLGQHNEEVYGAVGYTREDLTKLRERGVI